MSDPIDTHDRTDESDDCLLRDIREALKGPDMPFGPFAAHDGNGAAKPVDTASVADEPGSSRSALPLDRESFPGYRLVREVHRGGQGVVYQAVQRATKRKVAIKVLRESAFANAREKARFEREVQILAALKHNHIVAVHDSGFAGGHFYYVMDYISGQPLDVYVASRRHDVNETLRLFQKVCEAVNAAHVRGIIHRDLKPANIRVDSEGQPHVLDFGLAKMATAAVADTSQPTVMTMTGQFIGSLPWAAPEQAEGVPDKIDTRSDVYALGVMLYHMLTGRFPYDVAGTMRDVLDNIVSAVPTRPRIIRREIDDEVETIVLKCLNKERDRRYQTAGELARDIGHYLAGEPIEAKRDSTWYVLKKSLGRYKLPAAVAATILLLVTASSVALSVMYHSRGELLDQLSAEQTKTATQRDRFERRSLDLAFDRGLNLCEQGKVGEGMHLLAYCLEQSPQGEKDVESLIRRNLGAWYGEMFPLQQVMMHAAPVWSAVFSPNYRTILTGSSDGAFIWDAATGDAVGEPLPHNGRVQEVAYSGDGTRIATRCRDGYVRLWDARTRQRIASIKVDAIGLHPLAFSSDGKRIATTGADEKVRIWDGVNGKLLGPLLDHDGADHGSVAFSPNADRIVTAGEGAWIWDAHTGVRIAPLGNEEEWFTSAQFSLDGQQIVTTSRDKTARFWDSVSHQPVGPILQHRSAVIGLAFSPDGRRIVTGTRGNTAHLWDVAIRQPIGAHIRHAGSVHAVAFDRTGQRILTASEDGSVRVSGVPIGPPIRTRIPTDGFPRAVCLTPDGRRVATLAAKRKEIVVHDIETGKAIRSPLVHGVFVNAATFSPDGKWFVTGCDGKTAQVWYVEGAEETPRRTLEHPGNVWVVAFSPDGQRLITGTSFDGVVRVWDTATWRVVREVHGHRSGLNAGTYSPDGRWILAASDDATARLWDAATGDPISEPFGHPSAVNTVAFSPDGSKFITGCYDGFARIWDIESRSVQRQLEHESAVWSVSFSPDGSRVLTASLDETARIWDVATGRQIGPPLRHSGTVEAAAFGPDGRMVMTAASFDDVRIWDLDLAPVAGDPRRITLWVQTTTGMELDEQLNVRALDADTWRRRRQQLDEMGGPPLP